MGDDHTAQDRDAAGRGEDTDIKAAAGPVLRFVDVPNTKLPARSVRPSLMRVADVGSHATPPTPRRGCGVESARKALCEPQHTVPDSQMPGTERSGAPGTGDVSRHVHPHVIAGCRSQEGAASLAPEDALTQRAAAIDEERGHQTGSVHALTSRAVEPTAAERTTRRRPRSFVR